MQNILIRRLVDRRQINRAINEEPATRVKIDDEIYENKIRRITEFVAREENDFRIIMLAGPSGSGKTTTAKILQRYLEERDIHSEVISLDHFYLGTDKMPKGPDGAPDFESIYALDLPQMNECFMSLISDGTCVVPKFSFRTKGINGNVQVALGDKGIAIVEGIHALNPLIIEKLPGHHLLKMYVSVESGIFEDDELLLSPRDIRLVRRTVRDSIFRNAEAAHTLSMWPGVVRGEKDYLYPHKETADININSMHSFEPCLFRNRAIELFGSVQPEDIGYDDAQRIMQALGPFVALDERIVPGDCMLREFIGGGTYKY